MSRRNADYQFALKAKNGEYSEIDGSRFQKILNDTRRNLLICKKKEILLSKIKCLAQCLQACTFLNAAKMHIYTQKFFNANKTGLKITQLEKMYFNKSE